MYDPNRGNAERERHEAQGDAGVTPLPERLLAEIFKLMIDALVDPLQDPCASFNQRAESMTVKAMVRAPMP